MSNTLLQSSSTQTASTLLRQFINNNFNTEDSGEYSYSFELTDGENTYPISDDETTNTFTSALNQLLNTTFSSSTAAPPPIPLPTTEPPLTPQRTPPLIPLPTTEPAPQRTPEYRYQAELEQLRNMGYIDEIAIREALDITYGNISAALIYL